MVYGQPSFVAQLSFYPRPRFLAAGSDLQARQCKVEVRQCKVEKTHNSNIAFEVDFGHRDGDLRFAAVGARVVKVPMLYSSEVMVKNGVIPDSVEYKYQDVKEKKGLQWEVVAVPKGDTRAHGEAAYTAQPSPSSDQRYLRFLHNRIPNIFYCTGARLDQESLFEATPEGLARYIAARLYYAAKRNRGELRTRSGEVAVIEGPGQEWDPNKKSQDDSTVSSQLSTAPHGGHDTPYNDPRPLSVLDLCSGVGSNTIAFMRHFPTVVAVDKCPEKMELLQHNVEKYFPSAETLTPVVADIIEYIQDRQRELRKDPSTWIPFYSPRSPPTAPTTTPTAAPTTTAPPDDNDGGAGGEAESAAPAAAGGGDDGHDRGRLEESRVATATPAALLGADGGDGEADATDERRVKYYRCFDAVFMSPPWGGPDYETKKEPYRLQDFEFFELKTLVKEALTIADIATVYLPRTQNVDEILTIAEDIASCEIEMIFQPAAVSEYRRGCGWSHTHVHDAHTRLGTHTH
eukprot:GHVU01039620.1.p1 GENE.GHVU01039620.1~~GHVU01039620.1.p1  ORF type:complete len:516 (-),score=84.74 GHVU01039620.1:82-1629(-)